MKKIFSVLISLSVMLSFVTTAITAETKNENDENKWNLLFSVDVLDEIDIADVPTDKITKGEYMMHLIRLFAKDDEIYEGETLYSDVSEKDAFFDAANIAKQMGCYPKLELNSRENITYGEAVEILLRGMGYAEILKSDTVLNVANRADLPSMSMSKTITMHEMAEIFYSALHAPLCKYDISFGESVTYKPDDGKTILSEYYDIEIIEGIVTNNGITSLYSVKGLIEPGIEIDEEFYGDSNKIGRDYLGYKVRAYVDYTDDKDDGNLVYITGKNTTVTEIKEDDIERVDSRVTRIDYELGNKIKYTKISENAKVIYNGKFVGNYNASDIMPANGSVILIDNTKDDVADVVIVWSYETMFIEHISSANKMIYNAHTEGGLSSICLDEYKTEYAYDIFWAGDELGFSDLQKYQIISVAKSKNEADGYIRIEVSKNEFNGKVESINKSESELKIDGAWYPMLAEFEREYPEIAVSDVYKFYTDSFGNLAALIKKDDEVTLYAYLYRAVMSEDLESAVIKVFTQDSDWIKYEIKDKVRYNGKNVKPDELLFGVKNDEKRVGLAIDSTTTNRQIIKIKAEGTTINEIETASFDAGVDGFDKHSEKIYYRGQNRSFESKYFISDDTIIFGIPEDEPENEDAYRFLSEISWDKQYNITAYDVDEYGDTAVFTVPVTTFRKTIKTCLVENITEVINSEGVSATVLRCSFGIFQQYDIEFEDEVDYSGINKGDIIDVTVNEVGKIISYTKKYDYTEEGRTPYYPALFHSDAFLRGRIVKIDPQNERMIVDLGGERTRQSVRLTYANIVIKRYIPKENRVEVISPYSLDVGDYVIMDNRASYIYEVIVYEE